LKIYVANTDRDWYNFLASRGAEEVNFWRPSDTRTFRAIERDELFFFRLGRPWSKIAGFGTYTDFIVLELLMAWEIFGQANGCATRAEFIELIARHRGPGADRREALRWRIGCIILNNVQYYPESEWLDYPFPPGIMQGKPLDVVAGDGAYIWHHMQRVFDRERLLANAGALTEDQFSLVKESAATYTTAAVKERRGQGAFRAMVLDAYGWRCCVTGERTVPVVEAAHIQQYSSPESNHVQNGLALRADVHTLFDEGYVTVDEDYRFVVSPRLREDFENGREYQRFHGRSIVLPNQPQLAPSKEAIRWHLENVYAG
jgi:putative restriction endonuclease